MTKFSSDCAANNSASRRYRKQKKHYYLQLQAQVELLAAENTRLHEECTLIYTNMVSLADEYFSWKLHNQSSHIDFQQALDFLDTDQYYLQ